MIGQMLNNIIGEIFGKYGNITKAVGQNRNYLQRIQHFGGYITCFFAKAMGHKRRGSDNRRSTW